MFPMNLVLPNQKSCAAECRREQMREYGRRWREAHPEYARRWRGANRDKINERRRLRRAMMSSEERYERERRHYEANREQIRERRRLYNRQLQAALNVYRDLVGPTSRDQAPAILAASLASES